MISTMETKGSPPVRFKVIFPESSGSGRGDSHRLPKTLNYQRRRVQCGYSVKGGETRMEQQNSVENSSYSLFKTLI